MWKKEELDKKYDLTIFKIMAVISSVQFMFFAAFAYLILADQGETFLDDSLLVSLCYRIQYYFEPFAKRYSVLLILICFWAYEFYIYSHKDKDYKPEYVKKSINVQIIYFILASAVPLVISFFRLHLMAIVWLIHPFAFSYIYQYYKKLSYLSIKNKNF